MAGSSKAGARKLEALEVARLRKAQEVGLLLQGELGRALSPVSAEILAAMPRRDLKSQRDELRRVRRELDRFCRKYFEGATVDRLAALHAELLTHGSALRLPLAELVRKVGKPTPAVLRGAPAHATAFVSPLGLQFDFPEMHHVRDLSTAFADVLESWQWHDEMRPWGVVRAESKDPESKRRLSRYRFALRMSMLVCFNLVEAYINGIAFDYVRRRGTDGLSAKDANVLTEKDRLVSTVDKLVKVPRLVGGLAEPPLHDSRDPLRRFIQFVKPFRDSVVHASPFSASERFGGYDKLEKLWELDGTTVSVSVQTTLEIVSVIHRALGGEGRFPGWVDDFSARHDGPIKEWFEKMCLASPS